MPDTTRREDIERKRTSRKKDEPKSAEELLREQSKTETEERPYLDTEGGE